MDLPNKIFQAKLEQSKVKSELAKAQMKYDHQRNNAYLQALEGGTAHFKALALAAINPTVMRSRERVDRLKVEQFQKQASVSLLVNQFALVTHQQSNDFTDEVDVD